MKQEIAKQIHPLCDETQKGGKIHFTHVGVERSFTSCVNSLSGDRLSWFNNDPPRINDPISWVRNVFKTIRKTSKEIESIGDF